MAFNEKLNKSDLDFLDSLYKVAKKSKYVDDMIYFQQQVELLIGDLESPVDWHKYLKRIEDIYGYGGDDNAKS